MQSIILIGPMRAGKTTLSERLAQQLGLSVIHLDRVRFDHYAEMGYDADHAKTLRAEGGFEAMLRYVKPFEAALVERILEREPTGHVIDFGAGHSVYEEPELFARVEAALKPFQHVILIQPTADPEESIRILHQRDLDDGESGLPEINRLFVTHSSNSLLATHRIYNHGQTPEDTLAALLALVNGGG